jgi:hypothetical protein
MKTTTYLLIVASMGAAASGCGGADDGRQDGQASSSLLTTRVAVKQADGSYKRSTHYLTREQRKAQVDARLERDRQRRAGVQALTSEIELTDCENPFSLWIYEMSDPGDWENNKGCCVIGEGGASLNYLCGFVLAGALWSGDSGGLYGNYGTSCGASFERGTQYPWLDADARDPDPGCEHVEWIQLDW